ncbi:unnamed protein product [marine sediment metagenome]|uniref:Uroporphyrinogen decarboxylase (URO-D) domain-containing protein n=1 Tax=marine sediment metagenome TaxID=412755 RepID=X1UB00_9ZZZZ
MLPDLIETGIDAINPVQLRAAKMDPIKLKREFGNDITFWGGGCDTQEILPRGTPEQVKNEVRKRIDQFAPGGGFVFCPIHNVQPDVPMENLDALFEAYSEWS